MPKSVLVADDSLTIRKIIGMIFATEDFQLTTVDNGLDAINKARDLRPDLVMADVLMPGKNGYEVCEALKGDPTTQNIPVLLLTGTFEPFDENRARAAGADAHIAKPFESQRAIERLGAQRDGVIRGHALRRDGTIRDTVMYSMRAGEWPEAKAQLLYLLNKLR